MKSSTAFVVLFSSIFVGSVVHAEEQLKPVSSVDEIAQIRHWKSDADRTEMVFDKHTLLFDVDGVGKQGEVVEMREFSSFACAGKYIFSDLYVGPQDAPIRIIHLVWRPNGHGGVSLWVFRADGVTLEGPVVAGTDRVIAHLESKVEPKTDEEKKQFGPGLITWKFDLVFRAEGESTESVQARNILVGGMKFDDLPKGYGRRVE